MTSIHFPHPREDQAESYSEIMHMSTSIHFPHPREDCHTSSFPPGPGHFNPLPSSEGRRYQKTRSCWKKSLQSTSLIRGKTKDGERGRNAEELQSTSLIRGKTRTINIELYTDHFNPLPSSEGRRSADQSKRTDADTSIHVPHPREDRHGNPECRTGRSTSIHFPHPREDILYPAFL